MSTFDPVKVCKMALSRIGLGDSIDSLDDATDVGRACNLWYEVCRDRTLSRARCWPFQRREVALGLVEEDPNNRWAYSHRYPNDCLTILSLDNGARLSHPQARIEFEIGSDDTGRLVYSDESDPIAIYAHIYTDPGEWPDLFSDAVAWDLASEIALVLRSDAGIAANCADKALEAKASAMGRAQAEGFLKRAPSSYVTARGGFDDRRNSTGIVW